MIRRDDCIRLLAAHHTDEIVVPLYQAAFEWCAIKPWPLTYYAFGAMGQGSSHGLGFAIGVPERRVWVLDGDGSLLMNLGALVTIAEAAPENLVHFVFENGTYEANGAHPIPGAGVVNLAGIAKAAGIPNVHEFSEMEALAEGAAGDRGRARPDLRRSEGHPRRPLRVPLGRRARPGVQGDLPPGHASGACRALMPMLPGAPASREGRRPRDRSRPPPPAAPLAGRRCRRRGPPR